MADVPRGTTETNPVVVLLARIAAAVEAREREAVERRRTIQTVGGGSPPGKGGRAA